MSEINKTYRVKANINNENVVNIDTNLLQDYNTLDILSVKISSVDMYKLHNSNYGVIVGRVLANNGFGVPNAKISIFIESDNKDGEKVRELYPFVNVSTRNSDNIRYNLLPDEKVSDCHQIVGTFPNKRYMLDNDIVLEVFDKYYKYTTRTNNSGDYLIMGVPVGSHTLHMDLDLSDCGILSQKPRDFVHKGYTIEQFENPTMFKTSKELSELSQIFTQDQTVNVLPFWGNESTGEQIGITRADINISFKFETTCVFMGSVVSDNASNGITRKCQATENMGNMEELMTGEGTIEMIRKTPSGEIEEFQIKGTQLIDGNGVWCYQIPMNLDYMMTDEYGNMVPTDNPEKGIPTRASVRFRISMQDNEENLDNFYRAKVLVPHNPQNNEYDYEFGTHTKDESFRDLFMDNVYSVKSYIPRFQKKQTRGWKDKNFTGIKSCNFHGSNNPIPYNNIRIKLPLMFTILCALIKCFIFLTGIFNTIISMLGNFLADLGSYKIFGTRVFPGALKKAKELRLNIISEGLCPDLENWFFAPMRKDNLKKKSGYNLLQQTLDYLKEENEFDDDTSIDKNNSETEDELLCLTTKTDYLISCIEMNLAMEYKVINFDFYNDWINGLIYIPRFVYYIRPKKTFLGITFAKQKIRGCMDDTSIFAKTRRYTQQCAIPYKAKYTDTYYSFSDVDNILKSNKSKKNIKKSNNFHKNSGFSQLTIFGRNGGICHEHTTSRKQNVYYMKPCEWRDNKKVNFYATDLILLGSLQTCNKEGLPQAFKYLSSTSYVIPPNLALTNMETNGYLYINDKNTICAGTSNQFELDKENHNPIRQLDPNEGLMAELEAYEGAKDRNITTQYDGMELSDLIPLTEMAGISWNYTGPGQGKVDESQLYYPGGHFLGLSCSNSQTNIKSCLNLSRICELGVNMSQRIEDIKEINENNITYINTVPTGFISGNEIISDDFRAMFATLNQNILQANKLDLETGYYVYDFDFVKPVNFEGAFENVAGGDNSYNANIPVKLEDKKLYEKYGIEIGGRRPDMEGDESTLSTQTRTIEDTSLDYYRFRFGLDYDNLSRNNIKQKNKFLKQNGNKFYLPQYENSFYFYFGMKQGATAIDEFNRQFYSLCDTTKIAVGDPVMDIKINEIEICKGTGNIEIIFDNVELPLLDLYYEYNTEDGIKTEKCLTVDNKHLFAIEINGLPFANYTFYAIDSSENEMKKEISIGMDLFSYDLNVYDFNVFDSSEWLNGKGDREDEDKNIYVGGYAIVQDIIKPENIKNVKFVVNSKIDDFIKNDTSDDKSDIKYQEYDSVDNGNSKLIYVPKANDKNDNLINYNLFIEYNCSDNDDDTSDNKSVRIFLTNFNVKDGKNCQLKMGLPNVPYYFTIGSYNNDDDTTLTILNKVKSLKDEVGGIPRFGADWYYTLDFYKYDFTNADNEIDWLKKFCLIKSTNTPFSNNVFTDNDMKVIWGKAQNTTGVSEKFYNSEEEITEEGYNLDDDASYFPTNGDNYSAIAVDGTVVSGDYFGILSGGTYIRVNKESNIDQVSEPFKNSGYVFKPLPEGDLEYYFYSGNANGNKVYEHGNHEHGVFYPSFIYPVYDEYFYNQNNFYIWANRQVYLPENKDAEPVIQYEELAGRCEITVNNGLRYKGKLGCEGKNLSCSNISSEDFEKLTMNNATGTISGMFFNGYEINGDGEEVPFSGYSYSDAVKEYKDVDGKTKKYKFADGFTGQTDIYVDISEGYPDIEGDIENKTYPLSQYVNNISESYSYSNLFSDYATYEYKPGLGFDVTLHNYDTKKTYKPNIFITKEKFGSGNGIICLQKIDNKDEFIFTDEGNEKYIYLKTGRGDNLTYYVLCSYNNGIYDGKTVHKNTEGELCFIKITTIEKTEFDGYTYSVSWNYIDESGNTINKKQTISGYSYSMSNIDTLLIGRLFGKDYNLEFTKYMSPVYRKKIRYQDGGQNWDTLIKKHQKNYETYIDSLGDDVDITTINNYISSGNIFYFVDKRNFGNSTLYKIYPTFLHEHINDDGIKLNNYLIEGELIFDSENNIYKGNFDSNTRQYQIEITYDLEILYKNEIESGMTVYEDELSVLYESTKNEVTSAITSNDVKKSLSKLKYKLGNNSKRGNVYDISGFSITNNYYDISYSGYTISYIPTQDNGTPRKCTVTQTLVFDFKDNAAYVETGMTDTVTFYLGKESDGEELKIKVLPYTKLLNIYSDSACTNEITELELSSNESKSIYVRIDFEYYGTIGVSGLSENSNFNIRRTSSRTFTDERTMIKYNITRFYITNNNLTLNKLEEEVKFYVFNQLDNTRLQNDLKIKHTGSSDEYRFIPKYLNYYYQKGDERPENMFTHGSIMETSIDTNLSSATIGYKYIDDNVDNSYGLSIFKTTPDKVTSLEGASSALTETGETRIIISLSANTISGFTNGDIFTNTSDYTVEYDVDIIVDDKIITSGQTNNSEVPFKFRILPYISMYFKNDTILDVVLSGKSLVNNYTVSSGMSTYIIPTYEVVTNPTIYFNLNSSGDTFGLYYIAVGKYGVDFNKIYYDKNDSTETSVLLDSYGGSEMKLDKLLNLSDTLEIRNVVLKRMGYGDNYYIKFNLEDITTYYDFKILTNQNSDNEVCYLNATNNVDTVNVGNIANENIFIKVSINESSNVGMGNNFKMPKEITLLVGNEGKGKEIKFKPIGDDSDIYSSDGKIFSDLCTIDGNVYIKINGDDNEK